MLDQRRHQYLHAMGISVWQARALPSNEMPEQNPQQSTTESVEHSPQPQPPEKPDQTPQEKPPEATASPSVSTPEIIDKQPRQWLIWIDQQSAKQHATILADLQALCQHALSDSQPPIISHQQPNDLPDDTGLLGVGLSDENQSWLARQPNRMISIPPIAEWHNQPDVKQQVWRKLMKGLW